MLAAPSPGRGWSANLRLGASPQRIALLAAYEDDEGNPRRYRLLSGPPSGPLAPVLSAHPARRTAWIPLEIDVDADRVLVAELRFSDLRSRLRVLAPDGTATTVPWPGIALPPARLHGDRVAFVGAPQRDPEGPIDDVVVLDWRSGAVAATLGIGDPDDVREEDLDLAGDGRTIAAVRGRLQLAAPGAGITPLAPDTPATWAAPRFAGAGIAALRGLRSGAREPVVLEPGAPSPRPLGAPSTVLETLTADERGAAWISNGCVRYAPLDGSAAAGAADCPDAEVVVGGSGTVVRGRRLRVHVICIAATSTCRGTVLLREGRVFGRARFAVPTGATGAVDVRLTRGGMRHLRRRLRRAGEAVLGLGARVRDGREGIGAGTTSALITRIAPPRGRDR